MRAITLVALLAVAGCGDPVLSGNQNGGTLSAAYRSDRALLEAADRHCAKYGKTARFTSSPDAPRIAFACE